MSEQLEIEVPIERHASDRYAEAYTEYVTINKEKHGPVFLCYCGQSRRYFVSKYASRNLVQSFKTVKIIE